MINVTDRIRVETIEGIFGGSDQILHINLSGNTEKIKERINILQNRLDLVIEMLGLEMRYAYGIEYDKTSTNPDCTRIGSMELHRTLPIQSKIKGCLLDDDGNVVKYLPDSGWTEETLDGSMGQVMVELPEFYWKFSESGNTQSVMMSEYPLPGYKKVRKCYVSAYEATIDRGGDASGGTRYRDEWKMASVKNSSTRYRGGNNTASRDGLYKTQLGNAATLINQTDGRIYARRRKPSSSEWNIYTYQINKEIFWLFAVEYATRQTQKPVSATTTEEGYKQGGLGSGTTTVNDTIWETFNGHYPFVPIGYTDSLGNETGEMEYVSYSAEGETWATVRVPRYRGIEHPFGHVTKFIDGLKVMVESGETGESKVFVCDNPIFWNSDSGSTSEYTYVGNEARTNGNTKEIFFGGNGDTWAKTTGGNYSQYFTDGHTCDISVNRMGVVRVGGSSSSPQTSGFLFFYSNYGPSTTYYSFGHRLTFIPEKK